MVRRPFTFAVLTTLVFSVAALRADETSSVKQDAAAKDESKAGDSGTAKKPDSKKPGTKKTDSKKSDNPKAKGYQLQRLDEPAFPFEPVKGRDEETQRNLDATSWYLTGRLLNHRELYKEAMSAYQKSIELNPNRVETYRGMIDVALHLGDSKQVFELARKVVELDPEDFALLRSLGLQMARQGKLANAVKYLEDSRKSTKLKKKSGFYVLINRDLGVLYEVVGEIDKAADAYEVVFDGLQNPSDYSIDRRTMQDLKRNSLTSFEKMGLVILKANRIKKAREVLEAGLKQNVKSGSLNLALAKVYYKSEASKKALEQLELFFTSKLPNDTKESYQLLQEVLRALDKEKELVARIEKLAKANPRISQLQFFLAQVYVGFKRLDDAEKIYRAALKDSSNGEAYLGLASIFRQQRKTKELLDNLAKTLEHPKDLGKLAVEFEAELTAIQEDGQLLDELVQLVRDETKDNPVPSQFMRLMLIAQITGQAKKYDLSEEMYRLGLRADQSKAASVFSGLGGMLMEAERYEAAAGVYQEAVNHPSSQDNKVNNLLSLAFALEMSGKTKEALAAIAQGRLIWPEGADYREAWVYYHSNQHRIAIEKYEAFVAKYPSSRFNRQTQFSLSALYVRVGDTQKGEKILEEVLAQDPDDPGVNNDLGYLYADQGKNLKRAKSMIEKAVKAEPENAAYLDSMGWVLFKLGDFNKAQEFLLNAAASERGQDGTIWEHLGDCQHSMKNLDEAQKSWQKALDLTTTDAFPDQELVDRLKNKLKLKQPE